MASLVAQVSQGDDEKNKAAAAALAKQARKPQPAAAASPKKERKKQPGFCWKLFCWCCKSSVEEEEEPQPVEQDKSIGAAGAPPTPGKDEKQPEEPQWLLDPLTEEDKKRNLKTLVLDLDETLVHSSFTHVPDADFVIEIELDGAVHKVYVRKRPGVDEFLREVGKKFEVVVFTASLAKYADPLLDILDKDRVVVKRLFREACVLHFGNYVKDMSLLGRKLEHSMIVDNSPFSYMFQPDNAIPITSWFNDRSDTELYQLLPFLDQLLEVDDVTKLLAQKPA